MTAVPDEPTRWYSLPEVAELLGLRLREVRTLLREHRLLAVPHGPNGAQSVPGELLLGPDDVDGPGPLPALRGTLILLSDAGYDPEESFRWLFTPHAELDATPIAALRARRTHAVRRVAQTLAF
ncbi:Rv2175c family DNA-binding protein [Georgenia sp. EYE_87]|uniref:Rv2175c family DNA-binding protein n=1 Tax=Georgenia sp. EYE_87 TaxID=2853448 RepID=UPI0020062E06|nr:Rv2175c family DNA-binding protein [Georgenia sp. EYE_87]